MAVVRYETQGGVEQVEIDYDEMTYQEAKQHWKIKTDERDGRDVYSLIPRERVFSVELVGKTTGSSVTRTKKRK